MRPSAAVHANLTGFAVASPSPLGAIRPRSRSAQPLARRRLGAGGRWSSGTVLGQAEGLVLPRGPPLHSVCDDETTGMPRRSTHLHGDVTAVSCPRYGTLVAVDVHNRGGRILVDATPPPVCPPCPAGFGVRTPQKSRACLD